MHQGSSFMAVRPAAATEGVAGGATGGEAVGEVGEGRRAEPGRRGTPVMDWVVGTADRYRWWLFGVAAFFYVVGFTGVWRPEPDAGLYLSIGRNLAEGRGYTYQGKVDALAYPGLPYLWAGVFKVMGTGVSLWVPHLLILLMSGVTLGLTYAYFRMNSSRGMAALVTFNVAIANNFYLCAVQLRNDVPFLMGVMAFFTGYEALLRRSRRGAGEGALGEGAEVWGLRGKVVPWVLLCVGLAVAVVMRPTMLALVGAIVVAGVWSVSRGSVRKRYVVAMLAVVVVAVVAFYALDPRGVRHGGGAGGATPKVAGGKLYEQVALNWLESPGKLAGRMVSPHAVDMFARAAAEAMFGHELWIGASEVVVLGYLGVGLWVVRRRPLWFFYLLLTVMMMMAMAVLDLPHQEGETGQLVPRHFVGALPLMIYLWWRVAGWVEGRASARWGLVCVALMGATAIGTNLVKASETLRRQRVYAWRTAHGESETNMLEAGAGVIRERVGAGGTVVVPHKWGRQFAFYSGRRVVEATPVLRYDNLPKPVYVFDQIGETSVGDFLKRDRLALGGVMVEVPGGRDWRGKEQREWRLRAVVGKKGGAATRP